MAKRVHEFRLQAAAAYVGNDKKSVFSDALDYTSRG